MSSLKMRSARLLGGLVLALACWLLPAAGASALEPAASWKMSVQMNAYLESGPPGIFGHPTYMIRVKNVGAAPTSGEYMLTDQLPAGVSVLPEGVFAPTTASLVCKVTKATTVTVTCKGKEAVQPGSQFYVTISVEAAPDAPSPAINTAELEGGGVAAVSATTSTPIADEVPAFDFLPAPDGVLSTATGPNGGEITQAGAHPTMDAVDLHFNWNGGSHGKDTIRLPDGGVKNVEGNLPKGVAVNANATPVKCKEAQLESNSCPLASQVGTVSIPISLGGSLAEFHRPLYAMKAPPGIPVVLGLEVIQGLYVHLLGKVRSESDYGASATVNTIPAKIGVLGFETELWGVPTNAIHDFNRGQCTEYPQPGGCPIEADERNEQPLLTMPTSCEGPLVTSGTAVSWGHPNDVKASSSETAPMTGCNQLDFNPTIASQATTPVTDSPSGLEFGLHMPQTEYPEGERSEGEELAPSTANLKNTTVTLPAGMTLNASAANGLQACSSSQIGLKTPVGQASPIHFDESRGGCPDASKLGSVEVVTPLLEDPLMGSLYLAKPYDNPFGSLLAIYLAVEDEQSGIVAKLAGHVVPDPNTGQLTVSFSESPELPIEDVKLKLFNGPRASLKTPISCGTNTTAATLTPWTTPEGQDVNTSDAFATAVSPRGGACPHSEAEAPFAPTFSAGTNSPQAGLFSPFSLRIARTDGTQQITGIDTTLPEGLTGKLAGIPYCSEASIALAKSREAPNQGRTEQAHPSCPSASEVGKVIVGAGAGITPFYATGHVYLAGPYKGAPLSMVVITPAVAGPFDLGTVVTRVALEVGTYTAQIHAVSDPLPQIIDGIPLDIRSLELIAERPGFTLNPTSCEAMAITGSVTSPSGQSAPLNNSFQVGGCKSLAFKPKLSLNLEGGTKRGGHPKLKAVLTFPKGANSANIATAQVGLPHSEFLDQANIGTICTQPQLAANTCPAKSIYGKAKAYTPLLDHPLEGPVYLAGGFGHTLPDLVAELNGQLRVLAHGKVDRDKQGGIRNTFEAVPDAPVSKFVLEMQGGKKGLIVNSTNICRGTHKAEVKFTGQNGKVVSFSQELGTSCAKKGKKAKAKKRAR